MGNMLDVFDLFNRDYSREQLETMSLRDWLLAARDDKMLYASPAERMISAIGEQELIDTAQDPRLGRIFFNRTIKRYKAFDGFCGMFEIADDALDRVFHAVEAIESLVALDGPVEENPAEPWILCGVDQLLFADGGDHALGWRGIEHLVVARGQQPVAQTHGFQLFARIIAVEQIKDVEH